MCGSMDEMIEREWAFTDCRVAKYSWGFRVWASGWEDGAGHDVAAECEIADREE